MKSYRCISAKKKFTVAVQLVLLLAFGLFLFPGCQNNPSSPETPRGEVYVANMGAHSVMGFERHTNGSLADTPVRIIRGPATGLHNPFDVAIDGLNRIWVANLGDPPASHPSITVYEPASNGNDTPSFTLSYAGRFGSVFMPGSLVKFGAEVMLVAGVDLSSSSSNTNPSFGIEKATIMDSTRIFPTLVFDRFPAQLINPMGIAFKSDTIFAATSSLPVIFGLYSVPNPPANAILLFGRNSTGFNSTPGSMISGNNTGLSNPAHIEVDVSGNIFVLNRGIPGSANSLPSITVYGPVQRGNVAPIRVIQGQNTGLVTAGSPYGMAVDENGFIYVSTENRILVFDQTSRGNVAPVHIRSNTALSGSNNADLSSPVGIAVR